MIRELLDTEVEAVVGGKQEHGPHYNIHIKNSTVNQSNNQSFDGATVGDGATITFGNQSNSIG
jgi:hypothetical protein